MMNKVSFNGQKMVQRRSKNGPKTDQKWFKRGTKNGPELFGTPCILCPAFSKLLLLQQQLFAAIWVSDVRIKTLSKGFSKDS